jgi:hypothetical protein
MLPPTIARTIAAAIERIGSYCQIRTACKPPAPNNVLGESDALRVGWLIHLSGGHWLWLWLWLWLLELLMFVACCTPWRVQQLSCIDGGQAYTSKSAQDMQPILSSTGPRHGQIHMLCAPVMCAMLCDIVGGKV